jgi:hypothetical protein
MLKTSRDQRDDYKLPYFAASKISCSKKSGINRTSREFKGTRETVFEMLLKSPKVRTNQNFFN